jgi:hypothetical protein
MKTVVLHRSDIERISDILSKFPDVEAFELTQETASGIGSVTYVTFAQNINGHKGSFEVEVSGVENW